MVGQKRTQIYDIIIMVSLGIFGVLCLYPLVYTFAMSFSTQAEAARSSLHLFPREATLQSYKIVMAEKDIYVGYANTILRTIVGTGFGLLLTATCAYPLTKKAMPWRKFFSKAVIITMLFDGGIIPTYLLIKQLGLLNNRLVYILPCLVSAYNVIIMRSFFAGIPDSLSESAKLDGAGEFKILFMIILPLSKPVLATIGLWLAVMHWNSWMDGMLYMSDNSKQILQIFLQRIIKFDQTNTLTTSVSNKDAIKYTSQTVQSATIVFTILPILFVYPFVQKYFVKGVMIGAIKG